ncbi:hypothetical protein [Paenibacillus dendritiformis]|uniref:hypothetical protein n=1 Tax=Paenibacillus dendritiformis TaxID=130049 RepID=UPI000DA9D05A|nr:hypothetical protein [Paenibacillus dendritiformis]MDG0873401.1 hypothetical protein [Paenibacillus thiaminolyticus]PZM64609.1 hypothetical protein DOE73_16210 [Paenibacillus dendritiformis]
MQHIVKNLISQEQKNMLKSLKGASFNLLIDEVGEFALSIFIKGHNKDVIIKNIPTEASDGDEYPMLDIELATMPKPDYCKSYIGKNIVAITVLRDRVTWENNSTDWFVEVDIGIKIICEDEELLLVAHDSLAGLLKLHIIKNVGSVDEFLEDYWSMKTDHLNTLNREEINIC